MSKPNTDKADITNQCNCGCLPFATGSCGNIQLFQTTEGLKPVIGTKNINAVKAGIKRDRPDLDPNTGRPKS